MTAVMPIPPGPRRPRRMWALYLLAGAIALPGGWGVAWATTPAPVGVVAADQPVAITTTPPVPTTQTAASTAPAPIVPTAEPVVARAVQTEEATVPKSDDPTPTPDPAPKPDKPVDPDPTPKPDKPTPDPTPDPKPDKPGPAKNRKWTADDDADYQARCDAVAASQPGHVKLHVDESRMPKVGDDLGDAVPALWCTVTPDPAPPRM
jgi:outer membrane biosynthesis protein TonB